MENVFIYIDSPNLIVKYSGNYYPFSIISLDKSEVLKIVGHLKKNLEVYEYYMDMQLIKELNKVKFLTLKEWLLLN